MEISSAQRSSSEVPERGVYGQRNCLGRGRVEREKEGKKQMRKKGGFICLRLFLEGKKLGP